MTNNFRGVIEAFVVRTLEGEGTTKGPKRMVYTVFDRDTLEEIGTIDEWRDSISGTVTADASAGLMNAINNSNK